MQTSLVTGHFHGYASGQMELTAGTSHKQRWGQSCTCMSDCCSALTSELHPLEKMRNPGSSCMLRLLRFLTLRVYASKSRLWYFVFSLFGRKSWFSSEKQSLCFFFLCWFLFGQKARNLRTDHCKDDAMTYYESSMQWCFQSPLDHSQGVLYEDKEIQKL
jgi:hypothetical protein